ncbi:homoserine dehydrogenase [Caproiciproducens galactitolivorans]|uniref:Homoserine dehydrogenase n=1 Tax=Caproiciproducens galactitolivorans TaxID=642589 RepID=A0A4Z0YGI1_9FIRM|nr:homoserine dehydrogenase [Caproiciproducens galactitolivorans]QEY34221.1 homoserine dehydrogenase [Caproiciproducens galactitolivorans]TGJ78020.1 homoserine dehydrogenase [Caproiciproducens galactitolivorans]
MVKIAVMGYGVVGSGVVEVLTNHSENIARRAKEEISIKYILDLRDFPGSPFGSKFTKSFETILNDPEVKIVVEVMGGLHPSFEYVKACLEAGKSVVTSNKELVAAKGAELLKIAQKNNLNFLFEASVGGGIPIIRPISQCLAANDVVEIAGILNGTTNFILTKMIREQMTFEDALALAQKLGYAERNPAADIEGSDACRKICILASLAYGKHVYPEQVHTEGITKIALADVEYAAAWGGVVKLIGQVRALENGKLQIIVCPMFIPRESQLATVDDVFNGIMVRGDSTGDVVFYGKGAGKLPTASAVVADVIDCVKHFKARKYLYWEDGSEDYVEDYRLNVISMYVRAKTEDEAVALKNVKQIFGEVTRLSRKNAENGEFAFVTNSMKEEEILTKLEKLKSMGICVENTIRIGNL